VVAADIQAVAPAHGLVRNKVVAVVHIIVLLVVQLMKPVILGEQLFQALAK
jgi:hypothetical protein